MFGLLYRNGYYEALFQLRDEGWRVFPGTNIPILTEFTGIRLWDKLNTLGLVMFANIFDGSTPQLSLFAFYYGGHMVTYQTILVVESIRIGNSGTFMVW